LSDICVINIKHHHLAAGPCPAHNNRIQADLANSAADGGLGIQMANLNISEFFSNEASLLRKARETCIDLHGSDIRAAGNEVEKHRGRVFILDEKHRGRVFILDIYQKMSY